jgi:hypothetical protein
VTLTTDPSSPGDDGWFSGDVLVTVTPNDHDISIDGDDPKPGPRTVTGDGVHVVDAVAPDGSIVGSIVVPIDGTSPTIAFITPPASVANYVLNQDVDEDYDCIDSGSGVASCTDNNPGTKVDTSPVGVHTFTVTAQDIAGNPPTKLSVQYCVITTGAASFCGFFPPVENPPVVNPVSAGSNVPMKWRLFTADGTQRTSLTAVKSITLQRFDCSTKKNIGRPTALSRQPLKYDQVRQQYNYGFSTQSSWRGTCGQVTIAFDDGTSRFALFRFT